MEIKTNFAKNGPAQAAFLGAMLGILALALLDFAAESSGRVRECLSHAGSFCAFGRQTAALYTAKEMGALLVWLTSWFALHRRLRNRELNNLFVIAAFLLGIALATTLLWPPVTAYFLLRR